MRELRARQQGFTIVEVMVAALVLVAGSFAVFGLLRAAALNTQRAKGTQIALDRAQQELEALRSLSDAQLALVTPPGYSPNPLDPGNRVSNGTFALSREAPESPAPTLVVEGGSLYGGGFIKDAAVNSGPTSFSSGDVTGKIYRYIVWRNDTSCPEATCPGTQDYKRIVVAVRIDKTANQSSERGYVEVQSDFINPADSALNDPVPGANGVVTAQQFFLSDTPCSPTGFTVRSEIVESHALHNTLGACASGLRTGSVAGAPDALVLGSPPDLLPEDTSLPAEYDYSSDYPLSTVAGAAKGIQLRRDETNGCHYVPTGTSVPQWQVHRWVSDPLPTDFKMTGQVTLDILTRALVSPSNKATLCIYLFDRRELTPGKGEDFLLTNKVGGAKYWEYTPTGSGLWPLNWDDVRKTMTFNGPITIPADHRLGVALSVNGNTGLDAVGLMYDHPNYRARIEVETPTPIDGG